MIPSTVVVSYDYYLYITFSTLFGTSTYAFAYFSALDRLGEICSAKSNCLISSEGSANIGLLVALLLFFYQVASSLLQSKFSG